MKDYRLTIAAVVTVLLAWIIFATFFVPPLIGRAYRQESYPYFNNIIQGRNVHSLQHYLDDWTEIAWLAGLTLPMLTIVALHAPARLYRLILESSYHHMRPYRVVMVCGIILFLITGYAYDVVKFEEHWPFSNYAMYCNVQTKREVKTFEVHGVTPDGQEVNLEGKLRPFGSAALCISLQGHAARGTLPEATEALLRLHNSHGREPYLVGIRLYRCHWELDPWARNANAPQQTLLVESFTGSRP